MHGPHPDEKHPLPDLAGGENLAESGDDEWGRCVAFTAQRGLTERVRCCFTVNSG